MKTVIANRSDKDISFPLEKPVRELISGKTAKSSLLVRRRSVVYVK